MGKVEGETKLRNGCHDVLGAGAALRRQGDDGHQARRHSARRCQKEPCKASASNILSHSSGLGQAAFSVEGFHISVLMHFPFSRVLQEDLGFMI